MSLDALNQQLAFLREIDRLKSVVRQSPLLDGSRKENSAEHSWHLAMYALLLDEYAAAPVDAARVIRMLLIHDIVEVDVGDTPIHGAQSNAAQSNADQSALEARAAMRLFGMVPGQRGADLLALWQEFENAETDDAKFAKALDKVQPLLVNIHAGGGTWAESGISLAQVLQRYGPTIARGSPALWAACEPWVRAHFAATAV